MAFVTPTLPVLIERVKGDLNARMGNTNALIPRSISWVMAHALAGAVWSLYLYQTWVSKQVIPDTAEGEYLERWARIFGVTRTGAVKASGTASFAALSGSTLPSGAAMTAEDDTEFVTLASHTWSTDDYETVTIEASESGLAGNLETDTTLELVSPPAGVTSSGHVEALADGADEESDASLLERLLARIQDPPQGGSVSDFVAWAKSTSTVPVDGVWVYSWTADPVIIDVGETLLQFSVVGVDPLPDAGQRAAVQAQIDLYRPVGIPCTVAALGSHQTTLTIDATATDGYDVDDMKTNIEAELTSMLRTTSEPTPTGQTIPNSYLLEAIGAAEGVDYFELTVVDAGAGTDDVAVEAYCVATLGTVTWS